MTACEGYTEERRERFDRFEVSVGHVEVRGASSPFSYLLMRSGVCLLPLAGDDIVLVREARFAVGSWQDELPAGGIDDGEEPQTAAVRELREETGRDALAIESLGTFYPSFGSTNEEIHLFVAECGPHVGGLELDPGEELSARPVSLGEFGLMVADGRITHGAALALWARWQARGCPRPSAG